MVMNGNYRNAMTIFRWRTTEDHDDSDRDTKWRRYDKLLAFIGFVLTLVSILSGPSDEHDTWTTLQETVWETVSFLTVVIIGFKLVKGLKPEYFNYNMEPLYDLFEQKEQEIVIKQTQTPRKIMDSSTQTDRRNFGLETKRLERNYQRELRRLRRHTLNLKRSLQDKLKGTKVLAKEQAVQLSNEQLKLLPLVSRKESLLQEKETLEKQIKEEQSRQQDLVNRFKKVEGHIQTGETDVSMAKRNARSSLDLSPYLGEGDCPTDWKLAAEIIGLCKQNGVDAKNINSSPGQNSIHDSKSVREFTAVHEQKKVRMLYSIETGDDGDIRYVEVSPAFYSMYETGSCLLPSNAVEQMVIIALPLSDGTLQMEKVSRYTGGFPREQLTQDNHYMTLGAFRQSVGLPPIESLNPMDIMTRAN